MEAKNFQQEDNHSSNPGRRNFIKTVGLGALSLPLSNYLDLAAGSVAIIIDTNDTVAMSAPAQWAVNELISTLTSRGVTVKRYNNINEAAASDLCLIVSGADLQKEARIPAVPEALGILPGKSAAKQTTIVAGHDTRGLIYALLELNDRAIYSDKPVYSITGYKTID